MKALSADELARYGSVKDEVSKEVRKLRQECFPNKEEGDGKGRKTKKAVEG